MDGGYAGAIVSCACIQP